MSPTSVITSKGKVTTKDYELLKKVSFERHNRIRGLEKELEQCKQALQHALEKVNFQDDIINRLNAKVTSLKYETKKSILKANQKSDLVEHLNSVVKQYLSRTVKLFANHEDLLNVTKKAIPFLTIPINMTNEKFADTYADVVSTALSQSRAYVQQECKKRAEGK